MEACRPAARLPFRKRRPKLFFFFILAGFFAALWACSSLWGIVNEKGIFSGPRLGLVRIDGFIAESEDTVAWIEKLRKNPSVAGVLVRIDSSGGGVAPSQDVYMALKRLAGEKPVVASLGAVAASGGYYIAVAAREIVALPSTLTGSIGVRLQLTSVRALLERLGITSESLTTGKFKASGSPFKDLSPEERAYFQSVLDDMQEGFIAVVAEGRSLPPETVRALADGRIFTGRQALAHKLVDRLGDKEDALARLAALCALPEKPEVLEPPRPSGSWWKRLLTSALGFDGVGQYSEYSFVY